MVTMIAGTILLGVLIFFHELGHFVVAKACGVRVLVFSLGFGPRIFGFRYGDTDYRLSLLPLGGYVRMFGDDMREEIPEEEKNQSFLHKPVLQKSAIAAAGPIANFLLPIAVLFFVYWGAEQVHNTVVGTVLPGGPAATAGLQAKDRIISIDGEPVETFTDVQKIVETSPLKELKVEVEREDGNRTLTISPRAVPDPHPLSDGTPKGRIGVMPMVAEAHVTVVDQSPAQRAGLQKKDRIVRFNGEAVLDGPDLFQKLDAHPTAEWVLGVKRHVTEGIAATNDAQDAVKEIRIPFVEDDPFKVAVSEDLIPYAVTPDELNGDLAAKSTKMVALLTEHAERLRQRRGLETYEGTIQLVTEETSAHYAGLQVDDQIVLINGTQLTHSGELQSRLEEKPSGIHLLGVHQQDGLRVFALRMGARTERGLEDFKTLGAAAMSVYGAGEVFTRQVSAWEALSRATARTVNMLDETARSLWYLVSGRVSYKSLGGPITIFSLAGKAMEISLDRFIYLLCFISINLGLINLLPVPVLDGGHLFMFAIEAIRRKELSIAAKEQAMKVGFAMLMLLMVGAIFNDVMRFL
jgi:regulator of sigma E protease